MHDNDINKKCNLAAIPFAFEHFTRERDVNFCTVFGTIALFKTVFNHVAAKAHVMTYWEGQQSHTTTLNKTKSYQERINVILSSPLYDPNDLPPIDRKGPKKKLSLEQELLLIRTRLHRGLLQEDLAWRFQVSDTTVSKVITTCTKLLLKDFTCLIIWPSKQQINATLPICFKKMYPKTRVIIDCTDIFVQTPSSLEVQSLLWSE